MCPQLMYIGITRPTVELSLLTDYWGQKRLDSLFSSPPPPLPTPTLIHVNAQKDSFWGGNNNTRTYVRTSTCIYVSGGSSYSSRKERSKEKPTPYCFRSVFGDFREFLIFIGFVYLHVWHKNNSLGWDCCDRFNVCLVQISFLVFDWW